MVCLLSCTDTDKAWKKSHLILSQRSNFDMIDKLSIAFHAFLIGIFTSVSFVDILVPIFVN